MSMSAVSMFVPAEKINEVSRIGDVNYITLQIIILAAIATAVIGALTSCTVDTSGIQADWMQNIMQMLRALGYEISYTGHTLTIRW